MYVHIKKMWEVLWRHPCCSHDDRPFGYFWNIYLYLAFFLLQTTLSTSVSEQERMPETIITSLPKWDESKVAWWTVWKWIREAPTVPECLRRLGILQLNYPGNKEYFGFLKAQQARWAVCCFTWELTFGYTSSSHQQSIHASLKARLAGNWISLHQAPDFIYKVLNTRKINRNRIVDGAKSPATNSQLENDVAKTAGCANLVQSIRCCCTEVTSLPLILREVSDSSTGYYAQR